jgi:hypothetical protein
MQDALCVVHSASQPGEPAGDAGSKEQERSGFGYRLQRFHFEDCIVEIVIGAVLERDRPVAGGTVANCERVRGSIAVEGIDGEECGRAVGAGDLEIEAERVCIDAAERAAVDRGFRSRRPTRLSTPFRWRSRSGWRR